MLTAAQTSRVETAVRNGIAVITTKTRKPHFSEWERISRASATPTPAVQRRSARMSRPEKPDVSDAAVCEWGRLQGDWHLPLSDVLE
jgi:hypothetical protein